MAVTLVNAYAQVEQSPKERTHPAKCDEVLAVWHTVAIDRDQLMAVKNHHYSIVVYVVVVGQACLAIEEDIFSQVYTE